MAWAVPTDIAADPEPAKRQAREAQSVSVDRMNRPPVFSVPLAELAGSRSHRLNSPAVHSPHIIILQATRTGVLDITSMPP